jgi:hypothetical protein
MPDGNIALLCILHPASRDKQTRVRTRIATNLFLFDLISIKCLDLLRKSAREYYTKPESNCTTWLYNVPATLLKSSDLTICGLEIYTAKQAFSDQLNDAVYFQSYRSAVERESLYSGLRNTQRGIIQQVS